MTLCPKTPIPGSQGSQSWGVLAGQEAREALCRVLTTFRAPWAQNGKVASLPLFPAVS